MDMISGLRYAAQKKAAEEAAAKQAEEEAAKQAQAQAAAAEDETPAS